MAFAQGSRTGLSYVVESSFGTTPGSPSMQSIPYTSHSLELTKQRVQGNDIQPDRIPRVDRHGTRQASGDISVDLRATDYDDFLESVFFSSLDSSGVMKIGTTPKFLTIEDRAEDISQYRQFLGMAVSQMSINVAPNQMVQTTFSMVGQDLTQSGSSLGTPSAASGNEPFDSFNGTINEGGSSIANVSAIQFTLNNSMAPTYTIASATAPQLEFGMAMVEGTLTTYYEDSSLIDKFMDETETSIELEINDTTSGGSYTFLLPEVKYNGASVPVQDPQSRLITIPFVGIYDSAEDTNLKLSKA